MCSAVAIPVWFGGMPLSNNGGASYMTPDRRPIMVRALLQDRRGYVFAGTDRDGVFLSFDGGTSWEPANDGLSVTGVHSLVMDGDGNVIAGTTGGVFRATISGGAP